MSSLLRILCIGRDPVLLETRRAVVEKCFAAVSVGSLEEMAALTPEARFDVVLLCHSLSAKESRDALKIVRRLWPASKVLALASGADGFFTNTDGRVPSLGGPEALLGSIQDLVQTRTSSEAFLASKSRAGRDTAAESRMALGGISGKDS